MKFFPYQKVRVYDNNNSEEARVKSIVENDHVTLESGLANSYSTAANANIEGIKTQTYGIYADYGDNIELEDNYFEGNSVGTASFANCTFRKRQGNIGYATENSDTATFSGDGSTTTFTISSHGLAENPSDQTKIYCEVTPVSADAKAASPCECYPADADGDGNYEALVVKFSSAPASGTNNVQIRFKAELY